MFALMETYMKHANQHNEDWDSKCVHVTKSKVVADAWKNSSPGGYDGDRYYEEVQEIVLDEKEKTLSFV